MRKKQDLSDGLMKEKCLSNKDILFYNLNTSDSSYLCARNIINQLCLKDRRSY